MSDAIFSAVFDQSPVAMMLGMFDGTVLRANKNITTILGYDDSVWVGLKFADIIHSEDQEILTECFNGLRADDRETEKFGGRFLCSDGSSVFGFITVTRIKEAEDDADCFLIVFDHHGRSENIKKDSANFPQAAISIQDQGVWLRAIFEYAPMEIVLKDTEGRIIGISGDVVKELELDPKDVIGRTTADFLPMRIAKKYMDADQRIVETGIPSYEEIVEDIEGKKVRYSLSAKFPIRDDSGDIVGICSITNDITSLKQSEEALRTANETLEGLVKEQDQDKAILKTINTLAFDLISIPSKEELAWYLAREVAGQLGFEDCVIYFLNTDATALQQYAALGNAKNPHSDEIANRLDIPMGHGITGHVAKTKKPLIVNDLESDDRYISDIKPARSEICVPLMVGDDVRGVIDCEAEQPGFFTEKHLDILMTVAAIAGAKLKLIEQAQIALMAKQELSRTLAELEVIVEARTIELTEEIAIRKQAEDAAAAANKAKTAFLSSMSHELRTPMNSVLGFSQLLASDLDNPLTDKQQEFVLKILKNGELLMELINQILDLAKIEDGKVDVHAESVDAADIILECVGLVQPLIRERTIRLETDVSNAQGIYLWADTKLVRQILLNLLTNAIKYNREHGSVLISCHHTESGTVQISVADTGIGIPSHMQSSLFEPFNRLQHYNSAIEGTGIGLVISKKLAERMDGSIGFRSQTDQGSTFWVELPAYIDTKSCRA